MSTITEHHRPVCVKCQTELQPHSNDGIMADMFDDPQRSYRLVMCDVYKCPTCGVEIAIGFAQQAYAEHFEEGFEEQVQEAEKIGKPFVKNYEWKHRPGTKHPGIWPCTCGLFQPDPNCPLHSGERPDAL